MAEFAFDFWKRVDELRKETTVKKMCEDLGLKYTRIRDNRSENRYPNRDDMVAMAKYLDTTIDYLMTGTPSRGAPHSDDWEYVAELMEEDEEFTRLLADIIRRVKGER